MSLDTVQLWQAIQENGIASAADCRQWASEIVETAGNAALNDPQLLLAQLIKLKRITPFQANAFLSNSNQTLTIGRHRLLAPLTSPALSDWFEAIDPASNASRWLYAIPAERLQSEALMRHPPSLLYSRKQASVTGASLQSMSPPAMLDGFLITAATPAPGKPLRDQLKNYHHNILPSDQAIKIIGALAVALADLHAQEVVHGKIGVDQVWWDGSDQVTLLRDPFFPPVSPLVSDTPSAVGVPDDQDFRIRYAAPEFTAPAQQPTPATDMYALGCLWWELLTGRLPFWDTMLDKVPTSACMFPLPIPKEAGLSHGQHKCLEYLLAKTPSTRFQNGRVFLEAFKIVAPPKKDSSSKKEAKNPPEKVIPKDAKQASATSDLTTKSILPPTPQVSPESVESTRPESGHKSTPKESSPKESSPKESKPKESTKGVETRSEEQQAEKPLKTKSNPPATKLATASPVEAKSQSIPATPVTPPIEPAATPPLPPAQKTENPSAAANAVTPEVATQPIAPSDVAQTTKTKAPVSSPKGVTRKKKKKKPVWFAPTIFGGSILLLGTLGWLLFAAGQKNKGQLKEAATASTQNAPAIGDTLPPASSEPSNNLNPAKPLVKPRQIDPLAEQFTFAVGENAFPWLPPRSAKPYSLEMLPPGLQGLIVVKTTAWLLDEVGLDTATGLSQAVDSLWRPVKDATNIDVKQTQQVAIGLYGGRDDGWPELVYRITLSKPTKIGDLKSNWKSYQEQPVGDKNHVWGSDSYSIFTHPGPADDEREITQFTWGKSPIINDLAELDGKGSAIAHSLEALWQSSDVDSDMSLLMSTGFLFSTARNLLSSIIPDFSETVSDLIAEKTIGISFTTSLNSQWYSELRLLGREGGESAKLLDIVRNLLKEAPNSIESKLVQTPAHEYWRALALRYPQMLRALFKHSRFGLENGQIVANFYLPKAAAPNLAIASWMLTQPTSFANESSSKSNMKKPSVPATIPSFSILEHRVTINFEQEPLDSALNLITEELNGSLPAGTPKATITIDGKSFELSSVTRNQQIRNFRFMNAPLRELLTNLASLVNPDKTITSVTDPKQAVVWILDETSTAPSIIFTTRRGLEGSEQKIPKEFQSP